MRPLLAKKLKLGCALLLLSCCSKLDHNPATTLYIHPEPDYETASLTLRLPLGKALRRVVARIEAILEGPGMFTVVRDLALEPLGPATGMLGAITPGKSRTLTVQGYDLNGNLLFKGSQTDITIGVGDTTYVKLDLILVPPPMDSRTDTTTVEDHMADSTQNAADAAGGILTSPNSETDTDTEEPDDDTQPTSG